MTSDCRLYLISPPVIERLEDFISAFKAALSGGDVACFQLRLKSRNGEPAADDEIIAAAHALIPVAHKHDVAFLINDRPDLARAVGADGVHIGQSDTPYGEARVMLGEDAIIGVTCHNSRDLGLRAGEAGADYVAFGAFFSTETKEPPSRATLELLEWWRFATTLPCVAIGGVTPDNCTPLVIAGADFLAASGAVWEHADGPRAAVAAFNAAIAAAG